MNVGVFMLFSTLNGRAWVFSEKILGNFKTGIVYSHLHLDCFIVNILHFKDWKKKYNIVPLFIVQHMTNVENFCKLIRFMKHLVSLKTFQCFSERNNGWIVHLNLIICRICCAICSKAFVIVCILYAIQFSFSVFVPQKNKTPWMPFKQWFG